MSADQVLSSFIFSDLKGFCSKAPSPDVLRLCYFKRLSSLTFDCLKMETLGGTLWPCLTLCPLTTAS